jgi:tripartite ATP-independent transporter DctP family solute receptor
MEDEMKKLLILVLSLLFSISAFASTKLKIAIVTTPGSAQHVAAVKFKEIVEKKSNGKYDFKVYHSASLGNESSILQQIQLGTVDLGVITSGPIGNFNKKIQIFDLPFIFKSYEQADEILDGPVGREVLDSLESSGFKGMHFLENGFRNLTNNKKPVHTVDDVKGLKIRTMAAPAHVKLWKMLGANPTPMGWPINTELQQGTIDGQENPLWVIDKYKLYEVQKYLSLTRHVYSPNVFLMNLNKFKSLPAEDQKLFMEASAEASKYERKWNRDNNVGFLKHLKEEKMIIDENPDVDSFRKKVAPIYDDAKQSIDKELVEKLLNAISK